MKTEKQVRQKAKQVLFRHRKEHVRRGLAQRPHNCAHNQKVTLPIHMANRATLGVCGLCLEANQPRNVLCDSSMGGDEQAANCPYFQAAKTAKVLKEEFNHSLGLDGESPVQIGIIAKEYPDLAALMWVLGPQKNMRTGLPEEDEDGSILAFFGDDSDELDDSVPERPLVEDEA